MTAADPHAAFTLHTLTLAEMAATLLSHIPASALPQALPSLPPLLLKELTALLQDDVALHCTAPSFRAQLRSLAPLVCPGVSSAVQRVEALEGHVDTLTSALDKLRHAMSLGMKVGGRDEEDSV